VSSELLPILGVRPLLGRVFRADEDRPGAPHVVVIGYDLWRRRFQGDPAAIGRPLRINDDAYTVIGVMPKGFLFPWAQVAWVPLAPMESKDARTDRRLAVLARLKPGVSLDRARADVAAVAERMAALFPDSNAGWGAVIWSLRDELIGQQSTRVVWTLMGAVFFVLLIACANVANLLLARATGRQREIAVRTAFGAPRRRIVRQLLTESLLIALAGGALGVALAEAGIRLCTAAIPPQRLTPYFVALSLDGQVLVFTLEMALGTGLLSLDAPSEPSAYLPYRNQPIRNVALLVRTRLDPAVLAPAVRREIHAADAALPIYDLAPMESLRWQNFWAYSMFGGVFGIFGAVALALTAIGVYGVLAFSVAQRRHEIGVRMAIGAQAGHVPRLILGDGLRLAGAGVAAGVLGALALTPLVGSVLYAVSPSDPASFLVIALVLTAAALLASYLPARRALAADPLSTLRGD